MGAFPALCLGAGTVNYLSGGRAGAPRTPTPSHREEFCPPGAFLDCSPQAARVGEGERDLSVFLPRRGSK